MVHRRAREHDGRETTTEASKAWRRPDTRRHQGGRVAAKWRWIVWMVWASKLPCKQVSQFGPQNRGRARCGRGFKKEGTWRHHETWVEVKQSCEGDVSVR
uniref:Uncharacterized protein n=1 Tax=Setaria viridis TaxID=4556 RepID=A0A4U6V1J8_SETVI|nr:hypothetical protein SEVIR_4G184801v2 [Setaria viridis]